ncbi:sigma-70 family RNA polymerase sigma factor [Microbulbifer magnicolonia]|uniref:RNA polymerase sigma factor n=1 Tax=Microbulbifer magnicolonia TaxID=3109744 RepID=UPI002B4141A7|nr:sigma-70 family RNA polymerase sigma factor [Microbulbifer sp. GG15]
MHPHVRRLYRMAHRWTMDPLEAEDLVQDILTTLLPRTAELEAVDCLGPWLIKVLYRRYIDRYRRRRRCLIEQSVSREPEFFLQAADSGDLQQLELRQALCHALNALDDVRRDTLLLHDVEGYTASEVAEIMDINVGTVKSRLHRARLQLKKILLQGTIDARQPS